VLMRNTINMKRTDGDTETKTTYTRKELNFLCWEKGKLSAL